MEVYLSKILNTSPTKEMLQGARQHRLSKQTLMQVMPL
jgi:hypothetical protein